jgi:hypothetical protein
MAHGRLWPAHPHPLPDELLSSWIVRVAQANAIKLQTLCWQLFGEDRSPWNWDIDRSAPLWLQRTLRKYTVRSYWDVFHTTLLTYKGRLYPRRRLCGQLYWLLPIKAHGMRRMAFSLQFCPACLAEDSIPYFRKQWRLALFTYCPKHQCELYDECPSCHEQIVIHRGDFGRELKDALPMHVCHFCRTDLRLAACRPVTFPTKELHQFSGLVLRSILAPRDQAGKFNLGFFAVLHQLCRVICSKPNHRLLLHHLIEKLGQADEIQLPTGRAGIEDLRRDTRHQVLNCALWLMDDLGARLKDGWLVKAVRYNLMLKDFDQAPKWYHEVVKPLSNWRRIIQEL